MNYEIYSITKVEAEKVRFNSGFKMPVVKNIKLTPVRLYNKSKPMWAVTSDAVGHDFIMPSDSIKNPQWITTTGDLVTLDWENYLFSIDENGIVTMTPIAKTKK